MPGGKRIERAVPSMQISTFVFCVMALDLFVLAALISVLLALIIVPGPRGFISPDFQYNGLVTAVGISTYILLIFNAAKLYRIEVLGDFNRFMRYFQKTWLLVFLAVLVVLVVNVALMPRAASPAYLFGRLYWLRIAIWFAAAWVVLAGERFILARLLRFCADTGIICHKVVVVGATDLAGQFIERTKNAFGVRVDAIFEDVAEASTQHMISGVPVCGGIDDLLAYNKRHEIDTVVVMPLTDSDRMRQLVRRLSQQPLRVRLLPGPLALEMPPDWCAPPQELPGIHLMTITELPITRMGMLIKGSFDKIGAALALVLFAPLMIACAIIIKITSPGPVLFRQKRIGYRNREFSVFKFRSMNVAACNTGKLTERNDSRVFAFGQIMRKLSFDELPQLFNVIRGEMSLVGPRPHMPEARAGGHLYFDAVEEYAARHRVKPGITGWAQVSGWRGPTDTVEQLENRVIHDLYYIDNWSFGLDLKILVLTMFVGFFGKNAF